MPEKCWVLKQIESKLVILRKGKEKTPNTLDICASIVLVFTLLIQIKTIKAEMAVVGSPQYLGSI